MTCVCCVGIMLEWVRGCQGSECQRIHIPQLCPSEICFDLHAYYNNWHGLAPWNKIKNDFELAPYPSDEIFLVKFKKSS